MNTPGGNTVSTAEHTMALMLALSRNVAQANDSLKAGRGTATSSPAPSSAARRWAIVGLGRVGLAVAKRAQGFDMKVVGFDPFLSAERAAELGIESVSPLDDLWGRCDYITLHTPALGRDPQPDRRPRAGEDEARRPDHQLRPGRPDRRGRAGRGARLRARSPAPRSTSSTPSRRRPTTRWSTTRRSSSRPTSAPRPRRPRSRSPSRPRGS